MRSFSFTRENFGLIAAGALIVAMASSCARPTSNTFLPGAYNGNPVPPPAQITDQQSCQSYGGAWLSGNICQLVYTYLLMGGWSGYYWLAGPPSYPSVPLLRPGSPNELDQVAWTSYPHDALDKITFTGDPRLGSVNFWNQFGGDGCKDDQGSIALIVSDQVQTYSLTNSVWTSIANSGYLAFGFDRSRKSDWSDNCVEANNNTAIYFKVKHCVQNSATVACP